MTTTTTIQSQSIAPEKRQIGRIQATRLASLAGVSAKEIEGKSIAELSDILKWKIDPILFFFRKICGKVVKKDPVTGVEYPVPYATVYVEDTDCNFITFFPLHSPWCWHFPILCHREVIGTTKTDACGNFCVWVPRFDIDWILRWRLERVCYPIIFTRPTIGDLIPKVPVPVAGPWPPIPGPDPGPLKNLTTILPTVLEALAGPTAVKAAEQANRAQESQTLGALNQTSGLLAKRAFGTELPPPLPTEFRKALSGQKVVAAKGASAMEGIRSAVALKLGLNPNANEIANFNPLRYIGPFFRCYEILVPEWQMVLDVPDITFRVTQDTNGDGTEETIYSEGYFDVRWNAGDLSDVTLVASSIAKESRLCYAPPVPCAGKPAIMFAGFMSLIDATYFDATNGYALRPNRPSHDGSTPAQSDLTRPPAQTPFCGSVQFYGCVEVEGAQYYRILQSVDNGTTFSAVTGQGWNNYLSVGGTPIPIVADPSGWYPIAPINPATSTAVPRSNLEFPNLLLDWWVPDGKNVLKIELGNGSKNHIDYSPTVAIQADNTVPTVAFTKLEWKFTTESDAAFRSLLGIDCPLIKRGSMPQAIDVVFEMHITANHLRDSLLAVSGCGGGSFTPIADALNNPSHWYVDPTDNSVVLHQRYTLGADTDPGCYSFGWNANSRAMNPSGADGGNHLPTPDWYYDVVYRYNDNSVPVAVVNED